MYFKYGNFQHDSNLVDVESFTQQVVRNSRGGRERIVKTLTIAGDLIPSTASQSAIRSKIEALEAAYNTDGLDAGLYHDDGSKSPHFLDSSQSLSGVLVKSLNYPQGDNPRRGEYVTTRKFRIVLEAEYFDDLADGIVLWQENITTRGDGGPRMAVQELDSAPAVIEQVSDYTPVFVTQSGRAVGLSGWPVPSFPLTAPGLIQQGPGTVFSPDHPERSGNGYLNYPVSWRYEFVSNGSSLGSYYPTLR